MPMVTKRGAAELFGGLSWVHVDTGGFTESGGAAALAASRENTNVGYSTLGIRAATSPQWVDGAVTITPHGSLAWQYAFGDLAPAQAFAFASNGIAFGISGVPVVQNSALIEAGFELVLAPEATFDLSYVGQLAPGIHDNGVQGRLNWRF